MAGNEIHLDNLYIGDAINLMEDLERRVENFHKQKTYLIRDRKFQSVREFCRLKNNI
ncbi:MAG: hypothetical protein IJQ85_03295 [Selenomonadaceae bacterium]|nr:hypothetical protein [Selenomonadaceae bacterium]